MFEQATEDENIQKTSQEYINDLKDRIMKTREIVKEHNDKAREKQKKIYDSKAKAAKVTVGDQVLVKILKFDGKHKIADKFEDEIYEIIEQPRPDIPVFKVRSLETKKEKTLHRNHLHPVQYVSDSRTEDLNESKSKKSPLTDQKEETKEEAKEITEKTDVGTDEEDDSDEEAMFVTITNRSGDAHIPSETESSDKAKEKNIMQKENVSDETVDSHIVSETGESITDSLTDSHNTANTAEEVDVVHLDVQKDKDDNVTVIYDNENAAAFSPVLKDMKVIQENVNTIGEDLNNEIIEANEQKELKLRPDPAPPPVPAPRRSGRDRKPPARFHDYHMNCMVPRPIDKKLEYINILIESGILTQVDSEVAHRLLDTIMKS